jgi:hypothetical protein
MGNCGECAQPHTDPEKQDGDWCWDCISAELTRSKDEDAVGPVGTFMGRPTNATYRSRPPKFMLPPGERKKYGY